APGLSAITASFLVLRIRPHHAIDHCLRGHPPAIGCSVWSHEPATSSSVGRGGGFVGVALRRFRRDLLGRLDFAANLLRNLRLYLALALRDKREVVGDELSHCHPGW